MNSWDKIIDFGVELIGNKLGELWTIIEMDSKTIGNGSNEYGII